jgi:uncharacterized protein YceK
MSRWLPKAVLLAALVLPVLSGCSSSPSTAGSGKGAAPTNAAPDSGKAPEAPKDTGKGAGHHDPG